MSHVVRLALASTIVSALAIPAYAEEPADEPVVRLGIPNLYILTTDTDASIGGRSYPVTANDGIDEVDGTSFIDIRLAMDYTVTARLTVGAQVGVFSNIVSRENSRDTAEKGVTAGARVGHLVPLGGGDTTWLWPRVGIDFISVTYELADASEGEARVTELNLSMPLIWNGAGKFFVGGGPELTKELRTNAGEPGWGWGLHAVLGVYIGHPRGGDPDDGVYRVSSR